MTSQSITILVTIVAYKIVLIGIGIWASSRVKNTGDFFLGGQGLGPWVAGLSYAASTSSAWVLLGYTGFVFAFGIKGLWLLVGVFGGYCMTWLVMGKRLNAETRNRKHITLVDFLSADADAIGRRVISIIAALMILFCFVFYIAAQFDAAGKAFVSAFEFASYRESVLIGAVVIVIYCFLGGFWAASVSDAIQGFVMAAACVLVPILTIMHAGGLGQVFATLAETAPAGYFSLGGADVGLIALGGALGLVGTGLGALGQPQLLNRIMATKSDRARKQAAFITIGWGVIIYTGVTLLALSAQAIMPEIGRETVLFEASIRFLPGILAGVVTAAVLSAIMSTVDSLLLAAASAISHDLGLEKKFPERGLWLGRIAMISVAIIAVILTLFASDSVFERVLFSWVALGAAFGPLALTRCLGWVTPWQAAAAAMVLGFGIAVIFSYQSGAVAGIMEKWVSWIVGLAIILGFGSRRRSELETGEAGIDPIHRQ